MYIYIYREREIHVYICLDVHPVPCVRQVAEQLGAGRNVVKGKGAEKGKGKEQAGVE